MREIASVGNVDNRFVNYDPSTNPQGTVVSAEFMNDLQDELIGIQEEAGFTEAPGEDLQVLKSIKRIAIEYSKFVGEIFNLDSLKSISAWDPDATDNYFPAICLSTINIQVTLALANYPQLVPHLRAKKLSYLEGKSGAESSWSASISGSVITMPNAAGSNKMLAALAEDVLCHGGYTNWRTVTVLGTEYAMTSINTVTREITVSGTPTSGTQTVEFYPHRIVGSTTTAREFEVSGRSMIAPNDSNGRFIGNLRIRGYMQGHRHPIIDPGLNRRFENGLAYSGSTKTSTNVYESVISASLTTNNAVGDPISDGTNGSVPTGPETHSPSQSGHIYKWARKYDA